MRASSELTLDSYLAAMQCHDALDDGEAQPRASRSLRARSIDPKETIEDSRQGIGRNAGSGIGDIDANQSIFGIRSESDRTACRGVRQGV